MLILCVAAPLRRQMPFTNLANPDEVLSILDEHLAQYMSRRLPTRLHNEQFTTTLHTTLTRASVAGFQQMHQRFTVGVDVDKVESSATRATSTLPVDDKMRTSAAVTGVELLHATNAEVLSLAAVVIDCGSHSCRIGFAGEDAPRHSFPTVVAYEDPRRGTFIGQDAFERTGLRMRRPLDGGRIVDFDDMERIWFYSIREKLDTTLGERPVMLADFTFAPTDQCLRACEVMVETVGVPALALCGTATWSLFATGKTTGIVVDIGYSHGRVTPVVDGYLVRNATNAFHLAGRDIDEAIMRCVAGRSLHQDDLTRIKAEHAQVRDWQGWSGCEGINNFQCANDSQPLSLSGPELEEAAEILFDPSLTGQELITGGIHELVSRTITRLDDDLQKDLLSSVVLTGGTTHLRGFQSRLKSELAASCNVSSASVRTFHGDAWLGGSILASCGSFNSWLTKESYMEHGRSAVLQFACSGAFLG